MAQRGKRTNPNIRDMARVMAAGGFQPAEIEETLVRLYGPQAPGKRTVSGIVSEARTAPGEPWSFADADPADAAMVLPVLRALVEWTRGRVRLTSRHAEWIVRVLTVAPDIPSLEAGRIALSQPDGIEHFLAWAPWRGEPDGDGYTDNGRAYSAAWEGEIIPTWRANEWSPLVEVTTDGA